MSSALAIQRGHGLDSRARSNLSTDWPSRSHVLICNEVDNLVHEPGVTGHKSELMTSPASRMTWRGLSYLIPLPAAYPASPRRGRKALRAHLRVPRVPPRSPTSGLLPAPQVFRR